jgi:hypothetical protein
MGTARGRQIQEDGDGELKLVKKQTLNGREREREGARERDKERQCSVFRAA